MEAYVTQVPIGLYSDNKWLTLQQPSHFAKTFHGALIIKHHRNILAKKDSPSKPHIEKVIPKHLSFVAYNFHPPLSIWLMC